MPRGVTSFRGRNGGNVEASIFLGPSLGLLNPWARVWFVDGNQGNNKSGRSPESAFLTMAEAFNHIGSGDVIFVRGNIREELSTPAGIFDVRIIGAGNQPRHADAHTGNNGYSAATWKQPASPTAATPLLIARQQGWTIANILFDGPSDAAAIRLFRDGGSGDSERDASHAHIIGCKFVAGQNHIEFHGGLSQCVIEENMFFGATGASLKNTTGAGIGTNNFYRILNNHFHDNDSHIIVPASRATIRGNTFGKFTASTGFGVDLNGGEYNQVNYNSMSGDYDGDYRAGSNDDWSGNVSMDVASDEVGDNGLTTAVPVA